MNLHAAVSKVFDKLWMVESTKISLSLILKEANNLEIVEDRVWHGNSGGLLENVMCFESHPVGSGILDLLHNTSRIECGELFNMYMGNTTVEAAALCAADIAELLYKKGTLTIVNPNDAIQIYDDVIHYLNAVDWHVARSVTYRPPPAEDLEAFGVLVDMIERLALTQESALDKRSTVHAFFKTGFSVVSGEIHNTPKSVTLNNKILQPTPTVYKGYREKDYDFRTRK